VGEEIVSVLAAAEIPFEWLQKNGGPLNIAAPEDSIKVMMIQHSKGLEFPTVAIAGLGSLPKAGDTDQDVRLAYIGITRATERMLLTVSQDTTRVHQIIARAIEISGRPYERDKLKKSTLTSLALSHTGT
jgi:superfamily I DNA/RNA helicase